MNKPNHWSSFTHLERRPGDRTDAHGARLVGGQHETFGWERPPFLRQLPEILYAGHLSLQTHNNKKTGLVVI